MKLGGGEGGGDSGGIAFPTFAFLFALASWEKKVFQLFGMFSPWKFNVVSEYRRLSDVHGTTFDLNFKIVLGSLTVYLPTPHPFPPLSCLLWSCSNRQWEKGRASNKCFQRAGRGFACGRRLFPWVGILGLRGLMSVHVGTSCGGSLFFVRIQRKHLHVLPA